MHWVFNICVYNSFPPMPNFHLVKVICREMATESQNGRGWKGPLWVIWSNPPAKAGSPRAGSTAPRPGGVLNISREGESTTSLGSLGQGFVTLRGKKFFLVFRWNFLCSSCPLSCHWAPLKRVWPRPPDPHPADI